jgi:hypothetical protein
MTKSRLLLFIAALSVLAVGLPATGQELPDSILEIRLVDGSTLYGHVIDDGDPVRIRLLSGDEMSVARGRIRRMSPASGRVRDGEFWRDDPNLTRLFFSPTARMLPRGRGYIAAYELAFPFVAYAATDDIMLAGGTPLFGGLDERIVYFAPKVRLYSDGVTDVAVGGLFFEELGNSFSGAKAGALFGVLTRGSPDQAVTLGVAIGYDDDGFLDQPVVMLGGEFRLSRTIKLVTENYFVPDVTLLAIGPRFFGERLSADLGLAFAIEHGDDFFTLPLVNFVYVW